MPKIEARLFQIPSVKMNGEIVTFPFKRVDALFYYLICQKSATRQELVDLLWEDCAEETGYKNLRHTIYTLRKCLDADLVVTAQKTEVRLNPAWELLCDFDDQALRRKTDTQWFLRGFTVKNAPNFNSWVDRLREEMGARAMNDLSAGASDALESGNLAEAERLALDYLNRDGLDEKMVMFLMKLYRQDGRYYKAAALYQRLKDKLAEELGIAPLHETAALYSDIVNQWNETAADAVEVAVHAEIAEPATLRLTGSRAALLEKMQARYRILREGYKAPSLLLYGEAGCGKSYLLQHFLHGSDRSAALTLAGNCSQMEASDYLEPWKTVMLAVAEELLNRKLQIPESTRRIVARVFPVFSDETEQQREPREFNQNRCGALVVDAVALILSMAADGRKILLVFEDLQWMDAASQDLCCQVLRRLGGSQLLLMASSRTLNVDVNFMVDEAALERVRVPCFTEEETARFLETSLGTELSPDVCARIYEATAGNPGLLADSVEKLRGKAPTEDAMPDSNSILRQRMAGLSDEAVRLANVLSLFQVKTPCRLLCEISGYDVAQLYALSVELEEHSLIREYCIDAESYLGFLHPNMRDALHRAQSYFQRQPLHLRIADDLETHLREGDSEACLRLIYHCREGGDARRALRHEVTYLDWYTRGAFEIPPLVDSPFVAVLPEGKTMEAFTRELEDELAQLRRQAPEDGELDRQERLLLCAKARYLIYRGQYQEGLSLIERLTQELSPCPAEEIEVLLWIQRQRIAYSIQTDQPETCGQDVAQGLEIAERGGLERQRAGFLLFRGIGFCKRGEYDSGDYFLQEALRQIDRVPGRYPVFSAFVRVWQGEGRRQRRDFAGACAAYRDAEELTRGLGDWPGRGFLCTCYGRAAMALGDDANAAKWFTTAMEAFERTEELPGRCLAQAYGAYYAARERDYDGAATLLATSWESASRQSSLVEQGIRDSVLARLRRDLDQSHATDNALHRYLYRPLDIYCHRGMQRLRGVRGASYEYGKLEDCLKFGVWQAKPLTVENLYSKNKNFMTE